MAVRQAVPDDIDDVVRLGIEALNNDPYPGLLIDTDKVYEVAREGISSPANFCWVSERDGKIVGAVTALAQEFLFYERRQLSVVQFYTIAPGEGIKLIREMIRWADGRRVIKAIVFTLEHKCDPRIAKLLRRLGFEIELPVYMRFR